MMNQGNGEYPQHDGIEVLRISLREAVDKTFELTEEIEAELVQAVAPGKRSLQEHRLTRLRSQRVPGLKNEVAAALCSGDQERIEQIHDIAKNQAKNKIIARTATFAIQESMRADIAKKNGLKRQGNSTMKHIKERLYR